MNKVIKKQFQMKLFSSLFGGGKGIRTLDPLIANQVLCQLSYTPKRLFNYSTAL